MNEQNIDYYENEIKKIRIYINITNFIKIVMYVVFTISALMIVSMLCSQNKIDIGSFISFIFLWFILTSINETIYSSTIEKLNKSKRSYKKEIVKLKDNKIKEGLKKYEN